MNKTIPLLVCLLVLTTALASAQESRWSVGAHLNSIVSSTPAGTEIDWGLQARFRALSFLSVEGRFNVRGDESYFVTNRPVEVSALLFPYRTGVIDFYGIIGAGYMTNTYQDSEMRLDLGAGFEIPLGTKFNFYSDFRYLTIGDPYFDYLGYRFHAEDELRTTMGFNYRF